MRFPAKITSSCTWVAIPVDWVILHWYACGADGRSLGRSVYCHLITKFSEMDRFSYPWYSELRYYYYYFKNCDALMTVPFLYMGMLIKFLLFLFFINFSFWSYGWFVSCLPRVTTRRFLHVYYSFLHERIYRCKYCLSTTTSISGRGRKRPASPLIIEISFLFLSFRDHPFHFPKNTRRP